MVGKLAPYGSLSLVFGDITGFNMGRNLHAEVSSVIEKGRWRWSRTQGSVTQKIMHSTHPFLPHKVKEDTVIWTANPSGVFFAKSVWLSIREVLPSVGWHDIV